MDKDLDNIIVYMICINELNSNILDKILIISCRENSNHRYIWYVV